MLLKWLVQGLHHFDGLRHVESTFCLLLLIIDLFPGLYCFNCGVLLVKVRPTNHERRNVFLFPYESVLILNEHWGRGQARHLTCTSFRISHCRSSHLIFPFLTSRHGVGQFRFVGVCHSLGRISVSSICDVELLFDQLLGIFVTDLHQHVRVWPVRNCADVRLALACMELWIPMRDEHLDIGLSGAYRILMLRRVSCIEPSGSLKPGSRWQNRHAHHIRHQLVVRLPRSCKWILLLRCMHLPHIESTEGLVIDVLAADLIVSTFTTLQRELAHLFMNRFLLTK